MMKFWTHRKKSVGMNNTAFRIQSNKINVMNISVSKKFKKTFLFCFVRLSNYFYYFSPGLDLLLDKLRVAGADFSTVAAISGKFLTYSGIISGSELPFLVLCYYIDTRVLFISSGANQFQV